MSDAKRAAFEVALRRTLGFHLGAEDGLDQGAQDRELLVSALLDAAEEGTLTDGAAVGREFEDYLPDTAAAAKSGSLPSSDQQEEVELYEDIVRDALKHFPLDASKDEEGGDGGSDEDDMIEPGRCLLCERHMPLTRHHVMPKSTHKRYRKKGYSDAVLNQTIAICRPCHSAVHRTHDAATLAERFTTSEELLADETIGRFVAWARKQRTTSKEDSRNNLLRYRR